jgi:hypothetical protein
MNVMTVRAKVKKESVAEITAAAKTMFAAIDEAQPQGVRYASSLLPDGVTFVVFLALDDPTHNPLAALPEFREFQGNLKNWIAEPPVPEQLTVVGSYRLF